MRPRPRSVAARVRSVRAGMPRAGRRGSQAGCRGGGAAARHQHVVAARRPDPCQQAVGRRAEAGDRAGAVAEHLAVQDAQAAVYPARAQAHVPEGRADGGEVGVGERVFVGRPVPRDAPAASQVSARPAEGRVAGGGFQEDRTSARPEVGGQQGQRRGQVQVVEGVGAEQDVEGVVPLGPGGLGAGLHEAHPVGDAVHLGQRPAQGQALGADVQAHDPSGAG